MDNSNFDPTNSNNSQVGGQPGMYPPPPPIPQSSFLPATRFAGFWIRVLSYIIDSLIISIPIGGVFWIVGVSDNMSSGLGLIVGWVYSAGMESSDWQATVGKRVLGLWVTDENGRRISFGRATIRHFSKIVSAIVLGIGFIMVAFTERKQGLHDKMASTLVWRRPI